MDETFETPEGEVPTEYEKSKLRHVGESLPKTVFLVAIIELCGKFASYIFSPESFPSTCLAFF